MTSNRTLELLGDGRVALADTPMPEPAPGEVLLRVVASAICGSERQALIGGSPRNIGHEAVGVVIDAHGATTGALGAPLVPGALVGVAAVKGCGRCTACAAGLQTRCEQGPGVQIGLHADYAAVAANSLLPLPEGIGPADGVLLAGDTIGVPARALRRVPTQPGDRVLVIGLGPVGLAHVLVRSRAGCDVVAVEPSATRRKLAEALGASAVFAPGTDTGPPASLVIEATGRADCVDLALELAAAGGTVLQSGECAEATIRPSAHIVHKELTYTGCWYFTHDDYPSMRQMWDEGLRFDALRTHDVPAEDAQSAFDAFLSTESGKVVLRWN